MSPLIELADPAPGCLATEWALAIVGAAILAMVIVAYCRRALRQLLATYEGFLWIGGLVLILSMFVVDFDFMGPLGTRTSPYSSLTWNWGFPNFMQALPRVLPQLSGVVIFLSTFVAVLTVDSLGQRIRWTCVLSYLVLLFLCLFAVFVGAPKGPFTVPAPWLLVCSAIIVIGLSASPLFITHNERLRSLWCILIPASIVQMGYMLEI